MFQKCSPAEKQTKLTV